MLNGVKIAELNKEALFARLLRGLAHVSPMESHVLQKPLSEAAKDLVEKSIRKGVAKHVSPTAMRVADIPLRGLDKALTVMSQGQKGLSPERRLKFLKFVAEHPSTPVGAAAGAIPFPAMAELGMAATGGASLAAKRALRIPTYGDLSVKQFSKNLRKRGYDDVMDYLVKTKAHTTPIAPAEAIRLKHHLSPSGFSLV